LSHEASFSPADCLQVSEDSVLLEKQLVEQQKNKYIYMYIDNQLKNKSIEFCAFVLLLSHASQHYREGEKKAAKGRMDKPENCLVYHPTIIFKQYTKIESTSSTSRQSRVGGNRASEG
jgi:hypothetical protein